MSDGPGRGSPWGEPAAPAEGSRVEGSRVDGSRVDGSRAEGSGGGRRSAAPSDPPTVGPADTRRPPDIRRPPGSSAEPGMGAPRPRVNPARRPSGGSGGRPRPVTTRRATVDTGPAWAGGGRAAGIGASSGGAPGIAAPASGLDPAGTGPRPTVAPRSRAAPAVASPWAPAGATATLDRPVGRTVDPTAGIAHLPYRRSRWAQMRAMFVLVVITLAIGSAFAGAVAAIVWGIAVGIHHAASN